MVKFREIHSYSNVKQGALGPRLYCWYNPKHLPKARSSLAVGVCQATLGGAGGSAHNKLHQEHFCVRAGTGSQPWWIASAWMQPLRVGTLQEHRAGTQVSLPLCPGGCCTRSPTTEAACTWWSAVSSAASTSGRHAAPASSPSGESSTTSSWAPTLPAMACWDWASPSSPLTDPWNKLSNTSYWL